MFSEAFFTISKNWKEPKYMNSWLKKSIHEHKYMNKENNVWYIHSMECYSAFRKEVLIPAITGMDFEDIMLNEMSQSEDDKCYMIHLYSKIHLK